MTLWWIQDISNLWGNYVVVTWLKHWTHLLSYFVVNIIVSSFILITFVKVEIYSNLGFYWLAINDTSVTLPKSVILSLVLFFPGILLVQILASFLIFLSFFFHSQYLNKTKFCSRFSTTVFGMICFGYQRLLESHSNHYPYFFSQFLGQILQTPASPFMWEILVFTSIFPCSNIYNCYFLYWIQYLLLSFFFIFQFKYTWKSIFFFYMFTYANHSVNSSFKITLIDYIFIFNNIEFFSSRAGFYIEFKKNLWIGYLPKSLFT